MLYGVIAGTGIDGSDTRRDWVEIPTPYGTVSVSFATMCGKETLFMRRHGIGMNVPPHLVNYRANLCAMHDLGVRYVIATAAVGSLHRTMEPGTLSIIGDFIDFTKMRCTTIYDTIGESVAHTDFSIPYSTVVAHAMEQAAREIDCPLGPRATYVCVDGPRYETPAEIRMFAKCGGDIVGMTGVPEVVMAKEMGMEYGSLAIITNYAAGIVEQKLSHDEVIACVDERRRTIFDILERSVGILPAR